MGIILLVTVATLWFRHAQRSSVPEFDEERVLERLSFDQFGIRPGCDWCVPRFILRKFDLLAQLKPFYEGATTASSTKHVLFLGLLPSLRTGTRRHLQGDAQWLCNRLFVSASALPF